MMQIGPIWSNLPPIRRSMVNDQNGNVFFVEIISCSNEHAGADFIIF